MGTRNRGFPAAIDWATWAGEGGLGRSSGLNPGSVMAYFLQRWEGADCTEFGPCMILDHEHYTKSTLILQKITASLCGIRRRRAFGGGLWTAPTGRTQLARSSTSPGRAHGIIMQFTRANQEPCRHHAAPVPLSKNGDTAQVQYCQGRVAIADSSTHRRVRTIFAVACAERDCSAPRPFLGPDAPWPGSRDRARLTSGREG